jgi:twitching motility protein PilI
MAKNDSEILAANTALPWPLPFGTDAGRPAEAAENVFGIRIGRIGLLVSSSIHCEILGKTPVNPLPNVAPWLSGLLNLRGHLVPVFDLHHVLSEETADPKRRLLFVIGRGDKAAAVWIDGLPEIKESGCFHPLRELAVLPNIQPRFVSAAYEEGEQSWFRINFEHLFEALGRRQYAAEASPA